MKGPVGKKVTFLRGRTMNAIWFRHDLRIHDHKPLVKALEQGLKEEKEIVGVFVWEESFEEFQYPKLKRMGNHRRRFLIESLEDLAASLQPYNVSLRILRGKTEEVLYHWLMEQDVKDVFLHDHPGFEERQTLARLREKTSKITWHVSDGHMLFTRRQLPVQLEEFPMSFTGFRKKLEKNLSIPRRNRPYTGEEEEVIQEAKGESMDYHRDNIFTRKEVLREHHPGGSGMVKGGERAGLQRLKEYVTDPNRLFTYKETRDGLLSFDDSSKLSFWLSNGCLSPKRVYQSILEMEREQGRNESSYWLFFELLWREYFQWLMLATKERLFLKKGLLDRELLWHEERTLFEAWKKGETGYPLVDAAMVELKETGYMSNRARQNVASFLTKNLGINWLWGARYFEEQLVDYDPASNYGNWAYQAGVGTDIRELRAFNVVGQGVRYDPEGKFAKHWLGLPENLPGDVIYDPKALRKHIHWSIPVVDQEKSLMKRKKELGLPH